MRLIHVSDTHGNFPDLFGDYELVVHSGDFFPDPLERFKFTKDNIRIFQFEWLKESIFSMKEWLCGVPFLFTLGNHDMVPPEWMIEEFDKVGIKAECLHDRIVEWNDVRFYGFPYVPFINNSFNYEREIPEMQIEADKMAKVLNDAQPNVDVLVCHSALYKCLDQASDKRILGSSVISNTLDWVVDEHQKPSYYLHGHIHNAKGLALRNNMLVSNAATTQNLIEI